MVPVPLRVMVLALPPVACKVTPAPMLVVTLVAERSNCPTFRTPPAVVLLNAQVVVPVPVVTVFGFQMAVLVVPVKANPFKSNIYESFPFRPDPAASEITWPDPVVAVTLLPKTNLLEVIFVPETPYWR